MKIKSITWGIIGAGNVCRRKSVPAILELSRSQIKTITARDLTRVKTFAQDFKIPNYTVSVKELMQDPDIDLIYIATPPDSHLHYCKMAADAGKAVLVEKPMTPTLKDAETMLSYCKTAGVPLFVSYYRRALPHFLKIKDYLDSGEIGRVRHVHIDFYRPLNCSKTWRVAPKISPGGYFDDLASHQLDLLTFFFGPVDRSHSIVSNQSGCYKVPDNISAVYQFKNGISGSGVWCFNTDRAGFLDRIRITGEKGYIQFNTFIDGQISVKTDRKDHHEEIILPEYRHVKLFKQIQDELLGQGYCSSTGETALETQRFMSLVRREEC